jgi:prepilin-type N-terminal cleavage/methylation domain-containing protein
MNEHRHRQGFTLVELLVVIAILAVLAAVLFPIVSAARRSARTVTCASNLHQIGLALQLYHADWGRMPTEGFHKSNPHGWKDPLEAYNRAGAIYVCPEAPQDLAGSYIYRGAISLTYHEDYVPFVNDARTIRLSPTSVLSYCVWHAKNERDYRYSGWFVILRADGSVQKIPSGKVDMWGYYYRDSRWLPPPLVNPPLITRLEPAFPDEPWPPEFEQ